MAEAVRHVRPNICSGYCAVTFGVVCRAEGVDGTLCFTRVELESEHLDLS